MKNRILLTFIAVLLFCPGLFAQFQPYNVGANQFGRTLPNIRGIGIGHFPNGVPLNAALHVNTNYMNQSIYFNRGEVFRTDCPTGETPFWRMYRGGIPKANFYNPVISPTGGFDDLVVETPDKGSNILFKTGAHNRVIIQDGPGTGTTAGYVGIGPDFYLPQSLLHINNGNFQTYMQITNATTSATATDGFRVGIASDGTAELRQQEDLDIIFYTNNTEQMKITSDNKIKVNSLSSNKKNFVIADEDGTLMLYAINTKKAKISELETRITELEKKIYNLEQVIALK